MRLPTNSFSVTIPLYRGYFFVNIEEYKRNPFMTVATATKTVTPRKRRARKVTVKTVKVTTAKIKRPSAVKLISPARYFSDIKTRWSIHQYEIHMLIDDLSKFNQWVGQFK